MGDRLRAELRAVRGELREVRARCVHLPVVTATVISAVLVTAWRYGVFTRELPLDVAYRYGYSARALSMGHWSTLITSQFLTRNVFMTVSLALSLALMLGVYEAVAGSRRALAMTIVTALVGPLLVAAGLGIGSALGSPFATRTLTTLDYGASAVTAGAGGALVAVLGLSRLRRIASFWVVAGLVFHHQLADWEHLASFVTGYGLGLALGAAPVIGPFRSRCSWLGSTSLRPARLLTPLLVLALAGGAWAAGTVVPERHGSWSSLALTTGTPGAAPAQVVSVRYPTPSLGGTRPALLVLPAGYTASSRRYPVVEMLHGTPGSPSDIIAGLDPVGAETWPAVPPFIGVVPDGHGPVVSDGQWADTTRQRLGTAVSDDLRHYLDSHYRTNRTWTVAGLSSGGYGAAYLGARTPGRYAGVCAMSGNFTPAGPAFAGQSRTVLRADTPLLRTRPGGPRTLLVAGAGDPRRVRDARAYAEAMRRAGQPRDLVLAPGGHDWSFWRREFPRCLRYLLAPVSTVADSGPPGALI